MWNFNLTYLQLIFIMSPVFNISKIWLNLWFRMILLLLMLMLKVVLVLCVFFLFFLLLRLSAFTIASKSFVCFFFFSFVKSTDYFINFSLCFTISFLTLNFVLFFIKLSYHTHCEPQHNAHNWSMKCSSYALLCCRCNVITCFAFVFFFVLLSLHLIRSECLSTVFFYFKRTTFFRFYKQYLIMSHYYSINLCMFFRLISHSSFTYSTRYEGFIVNEYILLKNVFTP